VDALSSDAAQLTIKGKGFDAKTTAANGPASAAQHVWLDKQGYNVWGLLQRSTVSTLVYSFTHLAPTNAGALQATVTVAATWSSATTTVSTVVAATPTLSAATGDLSSDAAQLTIAGKGFDAWQQVRPPAASGGLRFNAVTFYSDKGLGVGGSGAEINDNEHCRQFYASGPDECGGTAGGCHSGGNMVVESRCCRAYYCGHGRGSNANVKQGDRYSAV
jgi:hypothetical protein